MNLANAYVECEAITRREAKNFAYGIKLLRRPERQAMSAVYALARRIDDIGDGKLPRADKLDALAVVRGQLEQLDVHSPDPVLAAVADVARRYQLPVSCFGEIIDGCERDVQGTRYASIDDLVALLSADAGPIDARSRGSRVLVEGWRQRMRAHEYGRLAGVEMIQADRIERWDSDELTTAGAPERVDARPGEIAVRVPVEVPQVGGDRLFGDALIMVLRADPGGLRIAAYGEVDPR